MHPTASKMTGNKNRNQSSVNSVERSSMHKQQFNQKFAGTQNSIYEDNEQSEFHTTPISNFGRIIEERGISSDKIYVKANQTTIGSTGVNHKGNPTMSTAYSVATSSSKNNNSVLPKGVLQNSSSPFATVGNAQGVNFKRKISHGSAN